MGCPSHLPLGLSLDSTGVPQHPSKFPGKKKIKGARFSPRGDGELTATAGIGHLAPRTSRDALTTTQLGWPGHVPAGRLCQGQERDEPHLTCVSKIRLWAAPRAHGGWRGLGIGKPQRTPEHELAGPHRAQRGALGNGAEGTKLRPDPGQLVGPWPLFDRLIPPLP